MNTSKQHELLRDIVKSTKAIRKNNYIPTSEVDMFIGIDGICKAIESANWQYESNHNGWSETINLYQFMSYMTFIQSGFMAYNNAPEEETKQNTKKWTSSVIEDFYDTLDRILKNDITNPKFV